MQGPGLPLPRSDAAGATPVLRAWQSAIQLLRQEHPDAYAVASRRVLSLMQGDVGDPLIAAMRATEALGRLAQALGVDPGDSDAVVDEAVQRLRGAASTSLTVPHAVAPLTVVDLAAELGVETGEVVQVLMAFGVMAAAHDSVDASAAELVRQDIAEKRGRAAPRTEPPPATEDGRSERERLTGELIVLVSMHGLAISVTELKALPIPELQRRIARLQQASHEVA